MKIIVYGIGEYYRQHKYMIPYDAEIVAFADSRIENTTVCTNQLFEGKEVIHFREIENMDYEYVFVCTDFGYVWEIMTNLINNGISTAKVKLLYRECSKKAWKYYATKDGKGYINIIDDICFEERTYTDFLSYEVLVDGEYEMPINADKYAVVDIGMNVGITSLWYASKSECKSVYGFEPFKDTYDKALNNLKMSPKYAQKINTYNYALSDKNEIINICIQNEESGQRSIFNSEGVASSNRYQIDCRKAYEEIRKIRNITDLPLVLNIDTEGSEFAILRNLDVNNGFENIIALIIEWHADPRELFDILYRNNFQYYIKDYGKTGLIFAQKSYYLQY